MSRSNVSRAALSSGVALLTLLAGTAPALAQQAEVNQPSEAPPQGAPAQSADAALIGDEIVVTARRRTESLIDVPISVAAFSGEALTNQGAVDITALQQQVPNLTLQIARGSNSTLIAFIRGVGQQDPLWGFEPGVGLYVDDIYVARPQGAVLDIFDVERVEVLRGPQGTLYGRNTVGGAIKYVTRRLGDEFRARGRGAYGSYEQVDLIGEVTVPIAGGLSVGGAVAYYQRDGYGSNINTGAEHYDKDVLAGRVSLEYAPTDDIFIRIAADRTEDDSNPRHGHRELPNGSAVASRVLDSKYDTNAGSGDFNEVVTQGVSGTVELGLSDALTLKGIVAYRDGETNGTIDFDNTPSPTLDIPAFYEDDQLTGELQLLYEGERIQGVAGIYYFDGRAAGAFDTVLGVLNTTIFTSGSVKTESYAAFADVSVDITDAFKLSLGGRYTRDEKEGTVFRANFLGIRSPFFGNAAAVQTLVRTDYTNKREFEEFTPRVSVSLKPTDDTSIYASYSKGFKSGGFDMRGDAIFTPDTVNGYDPETVDAYEVGLKGAFLDRALFINAALFFSKYDGQQVTTQVAATNGIASFVDNVGNSEIYGFELESRAVLAPTFTTTFALGYTNADFKEFLQFDLVSRQFVDVADSRVFQNTPEWNGNVAATWSPPLAGGTLAVTPSASFRSDYSLFEIENPVLDQDGYVLVDTSIVWTSPDDRFKLGAHGRNLFDERYRVGGYTFPGAVFGNSIIGFYGPPRTFTVSAEVRF